MPASADGQPVRLSPHSERFLGRLAARETAAERASAPSYVDLSWSDPARVACRRHLRVFTSLRVFTNLRKLLVTGAPRSGACRRAARPRGAGRPRGRRSACARGPTASKAFR